MKKIQIIECRIGTQGRMLVELLVEGYALNDLEEIFWEINKSNLPLV